MEVLSAVNERLLSIELPGKRNTLRLACILLRAWGLHHRDAQVAQLVQSANHVSSSTFAPISGDVTGCVPEALRVATQHMCLHL